MTPFTPFLRRVSSIFLIIVRASLLLFTATAAHVFVASSDSTPPLEIRSLLSIKSSLKDPLNTFKDWDHSAAFSKLDSQAVWCSWSGINCDHKTSQVTTLDLSRRNLSGNIPSDIKYLSHLQHLNFSRNSLEGPLPDAIFELSNLKTLDINHNLFNSSFPPGISRLESLTFFSAFSNNFTGPLPEELMYLNNLEFLNLGGSYFEGEIPTSFGKILKLKSLYLHGNALTGPIPSDLCFLNQLEHIELGYNAYTGGIPAQFSSLSNLVYLDFSSANLSGNLPDLNSLNKLKTLLLFKNQFSGSIPGTWTQLKSLRILDLSENILTGQIPKEFSSLEELHTLSLMNNKLSGEIPEGIGELPNLECLLLWNNSLTGILPQKLGSNAQLQKLDVSSNSLSGPIPPNLCLGNKLIKLILFSNQFVGNIPSSLANCVSLTRLRIQNNNLNGSIPFGFGHLPNLSFLELSGNNLSGPIPKDIGNAAKLEFLNISENSFNSELPENIWNAPSLQIFSASSCNLKGKIPDFIGCKRFYKIELDRNNFIGNIPFDILHCQNLIWLNLCRNSLTGIIPWEISIIPSITDIDLSHNFLTGTIPSEFNNCSTLENFNVSYNQLTGPVSSSGLVFSSLHPSSFAGNEGLCGEILKKPCGSNELSVGSVEVRQQPRKIGGGAIVLIMAAAFGMGLFILIASIRCFQAKHRQKFSGEGDSGPWKLTAFQRLNFTADDVLECLNMTGTIIGMGSTGAVYRTMMPGGEIIAVKKLWEKQKDTIRKRRGVLAEIDVLGNVRHRNIVRLLGCCSNNRCTMLLYEYMPNGSLENLLHGKNKVDHNLVANWVIKYKIALGVAQGMCYLHHDCNPVIVHRDLKPSNILLDCEMESRVADFGVAKLIQSDESMMSVIAGSYGYIAPEYAYTLQVDEKSDIYSFGVVLMEILTRKRAISGEFGEGNNIADWIKMKLKCKDGIKDIFDNNAGASREEMMLLLRVALLCTSHNPAERPAMRDVVSMLEEAKPKQKPGVDDIRDVPEAYKC